jgi:hypothetical protein
MRIVPSGVLGNGKTRAACGTSGVDQLGMLGKDREHTGPVIVFGGSSESLSDPN